MADAGSVRHLMHPRATGSAFETDPDSESGAPRGLVLHVGPDPAGWES